jgi:Putative lumazine-binding
MRVRLGFCFILAGLLLAPAPAPAQSAADREAVKQAATEYVEALYLVKPALIEKSVHTGLTKHGFWRKPGEAVYQPQTTMTYTQLVDLAGRWNKDGKRDTSIKEIVVLDVLDKTAAAKIVAFWGIDYMQLAKYDGQWKIVNILWQAHPPGKDAAPSASRQ